jgi:hypothetical protein
MKYIVCPADSIELMDPSTDVAVAGQSFLWGDFIRLLFLEPGVVEGVDVLDRLAYRRELSGCKKGVFFGVPDDAAKLLADACKRPKVLSPAAQYSAESFLRAIIEAPSTKPEGAA